MDALKILSEINSRENKERLTVTIDPIVIQNFRKLCGPRGVSPAIESLMREFLDSAQSPTPVELKESIELTAGSFDRNYRELLHKFISNLVKGVFDQDQVNQLALGMKVPPEQSKVRVKPRSKPSRK